MSKIPQFGHTEFEHPCGEVKKAVGYFALNFRRDTDRDRLCSVSLGKLLYERKCKANKSSSRFLTTFFFFFLVCG